ncbi:hypothetical protein PR048_021332 [Dryococelus australis]|uniref:Uncharacterized protein n=1 Tax=Dryococelus australis TaxID=614101 RepID=A0ABQ9GXW6_9NEOP|nr:hypothetical protein PR048_021332 [Dryococelus australis]
MGKCYLDFTEEERHNILHEFYGLISEAQNQFIATNVEESENKIQRLRRDCGKTSRRTYTRQYYLPKGGSRVKVCQTMFLNALCLGLKKVRDIIVKKRTSGTSVAPEDARGRHANHPQVSECDKDGNTLKYSIHYSREHTRKVYLNPDLSIAKMFRLYQDYCKEQSVLPRNEALCRKIFLEEFNFSFKKPKNDSCGKCDRMKEKIRYTWSWQNHPIKKRGKTNCIVKATETASNVV